VFLADGPVLLAEALAAGADVQRVFAETDCLDDPAVITAQQAGLTVVEAAPGALAKVLDLKAPRGVVAVVGASPSSVDEVLDRASATRRPVAVLVGLQDPGNLGTLIRVAEASGCAGVLLTSGSVDLHNPKTVRATAGAVFRVSVVDGVDELSVIEGCRRRSVPVVATIGSGGTLLDEAPLAGAVAVLLGAEAHGLAPELVERCDGALTIPMEGGVESLNAAVAGSIVLFEAARRRRSSGTAGDRSGAGTAPMGHNDPR
jgi:RNA methyltransferase, TrmH family